MKNKGHLESRYSGQEELDKVVLVTRVRFIRACIRNNSAMVS